jgi:excisionase family DNA binding protein
MNYLKAYTTESVFTTNEVAEMLGVSKQMIALLVKQGKISFMRQTPNGLLFHSSDIEAYRRRNSITVSSVIYKHLSGYASPSLKFFYETRDKLGQIIKIAIYFDELDSILDGYIEPSTEDYGSNLFRVSSPSMVITDTDGKEIWLNGCSCGYGGTGPHASAEILRSLNIKLQYDEVLSSKVVKIFRQQNSWNFLPRESIYDSIRSPANNHNPLFKFYQKEGSLVLLQDEDPHWDISLVDLVSRYQAFLPNPVFMTIFHSDEQARAYGYFRRNFHHGHDIAYRVILKDEKGNQIWLKYFNYTDKTILDDPKIRDILEYCDFTAGSFTKIDALKNWINLKILKQEPEPLVIN